MLNLRRQPSLTRLHVFSGTTPHHRGDKRAREDDGEDEEEAEQPAKIGRGRANGTDIKSLPEPRTPGTGKKRGRPPGSGKKDKRPKEKVLGPDGKPRGRGRPQKSESNATPSEAKAEKKTPPPDTTPAMGTKGSTRNRGLSGRCSGGNGIIS